MNSKRSSQFVLFVAVGAIGTAAHYTVLVVLVETLSVGPTIASTAGFAVGATINYFLNHRFTFRSSDPHNLAMPRFLLIVCTGAMINLALVWFLAERAGVYYLFSQVIATAVVLVWNFVGSHHWAFRQRHDRPTENAQEVSR